MLFLNHIAGELVEEDDIIRSELQVDRDAGRLVLKQAYLVHGNLLHSWTFSVLARDLDPERISVEPEDSSGVHHLSAISLLFRSAVEGTRLTSGRPPHQERFVKFSVPLAGEVVNANQIEESFRDFLLACGARPAVVRPDMIREHLALLHAALAPATRLFIPNESGTESMVSLSDDGLLLIREMRPKRTPPSKWTFELLSLDTALVYVRRGTDCWVVTLPAVERIETALWEISPGSLERESDMQVYFRNQTDAEEFANVCVRVVPEIRQRLYAAHSEN